MLSSQPESNMVHCACGRAADEATVTMYRSLHGTYRYHRCSCGMEWTEHDPHPDLSSPVTGDEVIEVHVHLKEFHGTLRSLLGGQAA